MSFIKLVMVLSLSVLLLGKAHAQNGIVTLTFDDSIVSQFEYAYPILKEAGLVGTLFVITSEAERARESDEEFHMTWGQLQEMFDEGWDIQSHTHSHTDLTLLTDVELFAELAYSKELIERRLGNKADSVATPLGSFDERVLGFIRRYYTLHFRAWDHNGGLNDLTSLDPNGVGRFDVTASTTSAEVCKLVDMASEQQKWLVLAFHQIVEGEPAPYQISASTLAEIVNCIKIKKEEGGVSVATVEEVVKLHE